MEDGVVVVKAKLDTKDFTKEIQQTEAQLQELERFYKAALDPKAKEDPRAIKNLEVEIEKTKNKLVGLYNQQQKINQEGFKGVPSDITAIGEGTTGLIRKVSKLALAVFSVRSAYMFVRQSVSTLSSYNEELQGQIEGIRLALANTMAPVIQWIVGLAQTLIQYLDYIIDKWFGFSIISNANAMSMKKTSKSAKELKKTLAGFDEVNMVSENKSGGGGSDTKPIVPSKLSDSQAPGWLKWIADNKDTIIKIAEALGMIKGASWLGGKIAEAGVLGGKLSNLKWIAGGIAITYFCAKQVWDDIQKLKKEIHDVADKGREAQKKWIEGEDDINELLKAGNVNRAGGQKLIEGSYKIMSRITGQSKEQLYAAQTTSENVSDQIDKEVQLYKEKGATKEQQDKIKEGIYQQYLYNLDLIKALQDEGEDTSKIEELNGHLIQNYQDMGGEVDTVKDDLGKINQITFDEKTIDVKANTEKAQKSISDLFKGILDTITLNISGQGVRKVGQKLGSSGIFSKLWGAKGLIYGNVPKLAMGGLINNPGAGVPYRGSIIGERGPEAVLPLTQTDQMQLLGQAIGKWITINAEVINNMNGRVISRELVKIQNQDNFSNNI